MHFRRMVAHLRTKHRVELDEPHWSASGHGAADDDDLSWVVGGVAVLKADVAAVAVDGPLKAHRHPVTSPQQSPHRR